MENASQNSDGKLRNCEGPKGVNLWEGRKGQAQATRYRSRRFPWIMPSLGGRFQRAPVTGMILKRRTPERKQSAPCSRTNPD